MFKRKKDSLEDDDFGQNNDLYPTYDDPDSTQKKKRSGCLIAIIVVFTLVFGGFLIHAIRGGSTSLASQSEPTLTVSVDDGVPAQVAEGLVYASYSASGGLAGIYDLQGQGISESASVPNSLPTTITQTTLSNLDAIAYPQGAFFDPQSGQLIVFGPPAKPNSHPASDDFLTALRTIYSQQDPAVSIDPAGNETVQNVRYLGQTDGTHFGWVMFESDRLMKTLSMGQDNITGEIITSTVPSHSTLLDLEFQIGDNNQNEIRRRFWFTVPVAEIEQTDDGQSMIISALTLNVKTEYLDSNWQTLANQPPDPAGQAFAQQLTEHYDEYAQEFPVLSDLKALAYWTVLAHWLNQTNLPIQPELWLTNSPAPYDAPLTTPAITVTRQNTQGNVIRTMTLWGGVDLGMTLKIHFAKEATLARLKEIFDQFKAWLGFAKVTVSSPALGFAPITPISLDHGLVTQIQTSLLPALQLNYSLGRWELGLSRLKRYGTAENSRFLLEDPSATSPVMLTYGGRDTQKNTSVFTNQQAGLWLEEFSDSYQLRRGQFQPDGQFSYHEDDFFVFDLQGRVLQDSSPEAGLVEYTYESGKLTSIQQDGQELIIHWNSDETIQNTQSGDKKDTFEYEAGLLTAWKNSAGATIRRFEYDSQGRLTHEFGADGVLERLTRYDKQNQILFQADQNNATLYDWQPDGTFLPYSGAALLPWQEASEDVLEEMKIFLRLLRNTLAKYILFARQIDGKVVILVNDRSYTVPDYMLKNPAGLRSKLASIVEQDQPGDLVLISNQGIQGVAFKALFSNAITLDVEKIDEARIMKNLSLLANHLTFTPQTASIINGIPLPEHLEKVGLQSQDPNLWRDDTSRTWKDRFDETFTQAGFVLPTEPSAEQIKSALSTMPSVLIVVAHSDGQEIYLPDGTKFNPSTLSVQEKQAIAAQRPLIILLSCDTAVSDTGVSFAQQVLDLGPRMVIAPNGKISAEKAHEILQVFFENLKNDPDALQAFIKAVKAVYENQLIPTDDGLDHFFEFLTWNVPSDKLES